MAKKWASRRVNKLLAREDKVTDEQVFSEQVDKLTSGRVNELLVREDKVTDELVFSEQVDKLTSGRVNELLVREDKVTGEQVNRCLVDKPLYNKYLVCWSTCLLVNFKNLVPMLLCLLFTLSTINLFTCSLVHSLTRLL